MLIYGGGLGIFLEPKHYVGHRSMNDYGKNRLVKRGQQRLCGPQGNRSLILSLSVGREFNDLYTGKYTGSFGFSLLYCDCPALALATKLR